MSLTSYRAAPPRVGGGGLGVGWRTWRRPTLPRLETQYHGRWGFSRPSSGWDRVRSPRQSHQVVQSTPVCVRGVIEVLVWVVCVCRVLLEGVCCVGSPFGALGHAPSGDDFHAWWWFRADWAISTGQLRTLPRVHTRPIDVMVYHGPRGDLVLRWVSRLDAFSGYPVRT